jgi:hypothetical protein
MHGVANPLSGPATSALTMFEVPAKYAYRPRWLVAVTMQRDLVETRRRESHQTWEASP